MEIKFNYKKSKRNLKKEIEKYILCSMIIFKQTQIKFDKDFILSEPPRHYPLDTEEFSFLRTFNEVVNSLSREGREIFIRYFLLNEFDTKIAENFKFGSFFIRERRIEAVKNVSILLGCEELERSYKKATPIHQLDNIYGTELKGGVKTGMKFNYKKSKRNLKKEIEKYVLCSMIIFKQTQIKFDKDFILSEPPRYSPTNTEEFSFLQTFNEVVNSLSREGREIFIRSFLLNESDIKIGRKFNFSEYSIRDRRKEVLKNVSILLGCAEFERSGKN